ncbi:MAG TPA: hypothetical protein VFQ45_21240, partial [Longimicrobium sp.]|nr:hypothetical protein [Longimicrobium sp.]
MPCLYCSEEGFSIGHHGACIHCNSAVCVAPGGRRDRRFHGENCVCGCDGLFCLKHFVAHAQDEHGMADGAACFPRLWTRIGIRGIRGGAALRARVGSPPEAAHDATEFLNTIRPGHEALRQAARELPGVAREYPEWGNRGEPKIIFEPAFFNDAVAETVVAQAADAVGAAYEGRPDPADVADL